MSHINNIICEIIKFLNFSESFRQALLFLCIEDYVIFYIEFKNMKMRLVLCLSKIQKKTFEGNFKTMLVAIKKC